MGPSSFNKTFLQFANKNVNLLRINLSHVSLKTLPGLIKKIRLYSKVPICIDTEGAQIRTKIKKKRFLRKNSSIKIFRKNNEFSLYPLEVFDKLKIGDKLDIGFEGLKVQIKKKNKSVLISKVLSEGTLEQNKGVHLINRPIKLNYVTEKDLKAIDISKKLKIKYFALSFTNSSNDVKNFNSLLKSENKIFKIETKMALKNLKKIISLGKFFLIDRGDLSKDISIEKVPLAQKQIIHLGKKMKKKVYVATNFLESMILNSSPTRGEVNDIYTTLDSGASGLVLAAETAIGNNPKESVKILKKIIQTFKRYNKSGVIY